VTVVKTCDIANLLSSSVSFTRIVSADVANLLSSSVSLTRIVSAFWERRIMLIIIRIIRGKGRIKAGVVASL
jgi:hypothetical protein